MATMPATRARGYGSCGSRSRFWRPSVVPVWLGQRVRIVASSDFHDRLPPDVAPCDLLLIAGDCLEGDLDALSDWLMRQPARAIVGVAGNHDFAAESDDAVARELPWTYLRNQVVEVDGLKIFGSPLSLPFMDWAFMAPENELAEVWATIPEDVAILLIHGPARGILDQTADGHRTGSVTLRRRLEELPALRLLVTGHIHEQYGSVMLERVGGLGGSPEPLRCVNASYLDRHYRPANPPIELEL